MPDAEVVGNKNMKETSAQIIYAVHFVTWPTRQGTENVQYSRKSKVICDIQQKQHVHRRRARQIAEYGDCEEESRQESTLFYNCIMDEQHKRKLTPWTIEKAIT